MSNWRHSLHHSACIRWFPGTHDARHEQAAAQGGTQPQAGLPCGAGASAQIEGRPKYSVPETVHMGAEAYYVAQAICVACRVHAAGAVEVSVACVRTAGVSWPAIGAHVHAQMTQTHQLWLVLATVA